MENDEIIIKLDFNPFEPKLAVQIKKQNLKFDKTRMKYFESLRINVGSLYYSNLISENSRKLALRRLNELVINHLTSCNNLIKVKNKTK